MSHNKKTITGQIKNFAKSIGVDLIGIAKAESHQKGEEYLRKFIEEGRHGQMSYLEDYKKRVTPAQLLPEAKSIIVIAVNYYREVSDLSSGQANTKGHGRIARYAYGRDYHKVLKSLLKKIGVYIEKIAKNSGYSESVNSKICVDSVPILEKGYAVKAGLGFEGKNTTLITPEFGSFVLLGEILTTLELEADEPKTGTCGTCTRCITACPTRAIISPNIIDARRCISYLTIENKGEIPDEFHAKIGNWIFGCDICQEVCPYNKVNARPLQLQAFKDVKIAGSSIPLQEILNIQTDHEYLKRFAGSPLMRAKRKGLQRNAKIVLDASLANRSS